jgi:hypothetical protein
MTFSVPSPIERQRYLFAFIGLLCAPLIGYAATVSVEYALVSCFVAVAGVILLRKPMWAVYGLVIGTSFDSIHVSTGFALLGMGDLACLALIPTWLAHRLLKTKDFRRPLGTGYLLIFLILCAVSLVLGVAPQKAYANYLRLCIYIVAVFVIVDMVRDTGTLDKILILVALCSLAHAVIGLMLPSTHHGRLLGLVQQPNLLGAKIAFGIFPMSAFLFRETRRSRRLIIAVGLMITLTALILTISRGNYMGLLVATIFWFRQSPRAMLLLTLLGGSSLFALTTVAEKRVDQIEQRLEFDGSSVLNRGQVALNAVNAVMTFPLFGVGYGQFSKLDSAIEITSEAGRGGHSFYLTTAASIGLPALLMFLLFLYMQIRQLSLTRRKLIAQLDEAQEDPRSSNAVTSIAATTRELWIVNVFQAVIVYHSVSLLVRGSQRLMDWTMFGLYAAAALIVINIKSSAMSTPEEPKESRPRTSLTQP